MKTKIALGLLSIFFAAHLTRAQDTAFTYQGRLNDNGIPANGNFEFQFILFDTLQSGFPVAPITTNFNVAVANGLFTTSINFGNVFTGTNYWLDVSVRTNGSPGSFTFLTPRQKITPTPYSIHSARATTAAGLSTLLPASNLSGTLSDARLSGNVALLNGNPTFSGSVSASNFSGLSGQPLEFRVNGATGFRLMPTTNTPNVIGGSGANLVSNGFFGATIAGGGATNNPNRAGGNFATVGGGVGNLAQGNLNGAGGDSATVAGGYGNSALANKSTVGGGVLNVARGDNSVVAGGGNNTNAGAGAFIGGGFGNQISSLATDSVIGGGNQNSATQPYSTIGGGRLSIVSGHAASILGGEAHTNSAPYSSIGGGLANSASGTGSSTIAGGQGNRVSSYAATIGGGLGNISSGDRSVVAGGFNNRATSPGATVSGGDNNAATNSHSFVGGGQLHTNAGAGAFIGGGYNNQISSAANDSVIGGGYQNNVTQPFSTIAGGRSIVVSGYASSILGGEANTNSAPYSSIGGGVANSVSGPGAATVSGGQNNRVTSYGATIGGGVGNNSSGSSSVVAGGYSNTSTSTGATVSGGENNSAMNAHSMVGGGQLNTNAGGGAFIGGGFSNQISSVAFDAVIGGGQGNNASGVRATIGGGYFNSAANLNATVVGGAQNASLGDTSSIGGGYLNTNYSGALFGVIGGGFRNAVLQSIGTVSGGSQNRVEGYGASIGGGELNTNSASLSAIGGGNVNLIGPAANFSTIPGGLSNTVTASYSLAAGFNANALHQGTFVWADSQSADFNSSSSNQFLIRAAGGVGINKSNPSSALDVNGTVSATGFSGSGAGLTGVASLTTAQTFSGLNTFANASGTGGRIQIGLNAASGDPKLITFGDSQLVSIGENVADDRLELKGRSIVFTSDPGGLGNVGIGRVAVANKLEVEGDASKTTATAWLANSDRRIKTEVQTIQNALATLDKVRLVSFHYTDEYRAQHPSIDDRPYLNVIAQEFQEIFPDSVQSSGEKLPNGEEILQVDTYPLTIYSAAAIQELSKSAQTKDTEIQNLKDQNASLEKRLTELEKLVQSLAK